MSSLLDARGHGWSQAAGGAGSSGASAQPVLPLRQPRQAHLLGRDEPRCPVQVPHPHVHAVVELQARPARERPPPRELVGVWRPGNWRVRAYCCQRCRLSWHAGALCGLTKDAWWHGHGQGHAGACTSKPGAGPCPPSPELRGVCAAHALHVPLRPAGHLAHVLPLLRLPQLAEVLEACREAWKPW